MNDKSYQPKYQQVKELIIDNIKNNTFPEGSFMPPENELVKLFGASRNTVRMALKNLRDEGIIISRQGQQSQISMTGKTTLKKTLRLAWVDLEYIINEGVYFEIFKHINYAAEKQNISVDYINFQFSQSIGNFVNNMSAYAGIVITGRIIKEGIPPEIFEILSKAKNVISIDNVKTNPARTIIGTDNYQGARLAVDTLVAAGRKKIAFLGISGAFYRYHPFTERLNGYRDAIAHHRLCNSPALTVISAEMSDSYDVRSLLEKTLEKEPDIDAFFAISDFIAVQTLYALKGMGFNVPFDIAIMGFDGLPVGESVAPRLTSIAPPFSAIAEKIIQKIISADFPDEKTYIPVPANLVSRESV